MHAIACSKYVNHGRPQWIKFIAYVLTILWHIYSSLINMRCLHVLLHIYSLQNNKCPLHMCYEMSKNK